MIDATRIKTLLPAFFVLVALLVAACGSSGSDPLTKSEFLKQGNEICAQASSQRREDVKNFEGEGGAAGMEELVSTAISPIRDMAGELRSLEAPPAQMKAVKVYVAKLDQGIAKVEAKPSEAISGSPFEGANTAAQSAGLPACTI
jgi:hypothetical protein